MFPRACHRLQHFPQLTLATFFPRLTPAATIPENAFGFMFSRALHWLQNFPQLTLATFFPRLTPAATIPENAFGFMFSRLKPVATFPAVDVGYMFSHSTLTSCNNSQNAFGYLFSLADAGCTFLLSILIVRCVINLCCDG